MSRASLQLIGRSPAFIRAVSLIERVARFDAPVLIVGETGTGKEMAARAVHYLSSRRTAPFIPLNCGALPEALIESELYGYERGAFTDARQARAGLIAAAEGGTLFLDELDALPPRAQVSLLRFLQDRGYRPVGSQRERLGDVRIVAAASPRLRSMLGSGTFRDDLAFRLDVLTIDMPTLAERPGDPALLAEHFIGQHARHYGVSPRPLDPHCFAWLDTYAWPGNVRELDNLVRRALLLSDDERLSLQPPACRPAAPTAAAAAGGELAPYCAARQSALDRFERDYLVQLMRRAAGNVTVAARLAGKERRALGKLLKKHGVDRAGFHAEARRAA